LTDAIQIRLGGYGPPTTTHSRALKLIGDRLEARFGAAVDIKYVWNIMDFGYRSKDILWLVECGILTLGYQSTSYFTERVPELGMADLPFLFADLEQARAAYDGPLGEYFRERIEARVDHRVLGYFENGYRHISNRLRPVRRPDDLAGMRIRMLPSRVHARAFELLGAVPMRMDLTEAVDGMKAVEIDAQENPLANTVTYGAHRFHRFHTLTGHFYLSRAVFVNRAAFGAWPEALRAAMREAVAEAVPYQRRLAVEEEARSRAAIEAEGCEVIDLTPAEQQAFRIAVQPLHEEAGAMFGPEPFALLAGATAARG
jgi:TRAP-type C4-dicarboxylate transport system substrate-binding protein